MLRILSPALKACVGGRHVRFESVDLHGLVLHLRNEAKVVEGEIVGGALVLDKYFCVGAAAIVNIGKGNGLVEVEERPDADLVPGGVLDGVVVDDGVSALDAGAGGGRVEGDVVDVRGPVDELLYLVVEHRYTRHKAESENEVGEGAGERDEHALPAGMGVEVAGVAGAGLGVIWSVEGGLAGHLDVTAEGDDGELVLGVAAFEAEEGVCRSR